MENPSIVTQDSQDHKFLNALAEAFRLQESVINSTDLAIVSLSPEGLITGFNRTAESLLGYKAEELIGKETPMIFHSLDELINRSQKTSTELGMSIEPNLDLLTVRSRVKQSPNWEEWTLTRKDGGRFPAMISVSALWDDREMLMGYVYMPSDISQKKESEARVKASEEKFRLLAENIPGVIYLCHNDEAYSMVYINEQVEEITGYKAQEFLSGQIHLSQLLHPQDLISVREEIENALKHHQRFQLNYRIKHKSGEWKWIDEVGIGVYDDGQITMLEGFFSDITAQKEAEEKLQKTIQENLRVFNNPVNLNAVAGFDKYFKRINPSWSVLLGWTEQELLSRPFTDFVHPDDIESTRNAADFIAEGNALFTFENRYRAKDGSYFWLLWGSACDAEHKLVYATAIDITERKKSEEQLLNSKKNIEAIAVKLQEQNQRLDEFAHIISHNLRAPIGNIQALINLLDDKSSINEFKMIFEKLKNLSKNLGQTMNDLMDTLKVKNYSDLERVDIRFKDLLDKVVQSLEGELMQAEASVTYDFNKAPTIQYPKAYLESIFQNLLSNAIKYREPGRKALIHFETEVVRDKIRLKVTDNGQGIDLEKFGDELFGLHRTFHTHEEARGVGLFLVKTQIESMGGFIKAESAVGKGTTFTIVF